MGIYCNNLNVILMKSKIAKLIPEPLSQYFPKCARADEDMRIDLISLGCSYVLGTDGHVKNSKYALWAFVMAALVDKEYYNELGKEPLSPGVYNFHGIQVMIFFDTLKPVKKFYYRKLMRLKLYLENCY